MPCPFLFFLLDVVSGVGAFAVFKAKERQKRYNENNGVEEKVDHPIYIVKRQASLTG
jgi:hypothetical protein